MLSLLVLNVLLGFAIGASLGLLGGGGSILTVPALVYLVGQTPQVAVTTSLAIVGANSALGAVFHGRQGTLNWRVALLFGGSGMIFSYIAAGFSKQVSPTILMVLFALLMLFIGGLLLRQKQPTPQTTQQTRITLWKVIGGGAGVGLMTGILGVGGGFLIVPALVMLVGLPMHHAVGTSLIIIAMNSAAGFIGHLGDNLPDFRLIVIFVSAGIAGTFAGVHLGKHLEAAWLRRIFALFVITLALFLLYDNLPHLFVS